MKNSAASNVFALKKPGSNPVKCPNCRKDVEELVKIDPGMKLRLQREEVEGAPNECCQDCYKEFEGMVSKGAKLRAEAIAKQQRLEQVWKSRISLLKQARNMMEAKRYNEAGQLYERYVIIICHIFKSDFSEIQPDIFKGRSSELTAFVNALWDLVNIYDQTGGKLQRQGEVATKLAQFVRFSTLYPAIMRQAEKRVRSSKNPQIYKAFLKMALEDRPRCFIATAAFEYPNAEPVQQLRRFRDNHLAKKNWGRSFIYYYYLHSPKIARWLHQNPWAKPAVRSILFVLLAFLPKNK